MRVVVVGAGAVGRCYADALVRGGAEVTFRVRRPLDEDRFVVYGLARGGVSTRSFTARSVTTDAEVAAWRPDVVLLTVPTDALREGDWLAPLLAAAGDALVVALEPGAEDERTLRAARPDVKLAQGIIALIAYLAPLPGETRFPEPGVAVWAPLTCPFAGPPEVRPALAAFVEVLSRGGLKASIVDDIAGDSAFGTIVMATWVTALRAGGWTFAGLAEVGPLAHRAVLQGVAVAAAHAGRPAPWWPWWLGPRTLRAGLAVAARWIPLPLETYLRVHFTKVGSQTRMHLRDAVADGTARGLPVDALAAVLAQADERNPLPKP